MATIFIVFFILCIVLGILIAPILLIFVRRSNGKLLSQMRDIKSKLDNGTPNLSQAKTLRSQAEDIELKIAKTNDKLSMKEASRLLESIKDLVREIR